jgi:hypothetical protein
MRYRISKLWKGLCGLDVPSTTPKSIVGHWSNHSWRQLSRRYFYSCFLHRFLAGICLICAILCTMFRTQLINTSSKFLRISLKRWLTTHSWIICISHLIWTRIHPRSISYSSQISRLTPIMLRKVLLYIAMSHHVATTQLQVLMRSMGLLFMVQRSAICRWKDINVWWTK